MPSAGGHSRAEESQRKLLRESREYHAVLATAREGAAEKHRAAKHMRSEEREERRAQAVKAAGDQSADQFGKLLSILGLMVKQCHCNTLIPV